MMLLRSLLFELFLIGSSVVYSSLILLLALVAPPTLLARLGRHWARANLAALRLLCNLDYRVQGLGQLPDEASVVLCKHQSAWETIALRLILPLDQSWVLKHELMRIPIFGWALGLFQPIAIDRSAGRGAMKKLIAKGVDLLNDNRWVIVFPEGTRVAPGARHRYGIGGALLAERSGRSVVPIAHNAGHFWGRRSLVKRPGTIDLVIGPTLTSRGQKASDINLVAQEWIESTVAKLPDPFGSETGRRSPQGLNVAGHPASHGKR